MREGETEAGDVGESANTASRRSSGPMPRAWAMLAPEASQARCESRQPFGCPVVPDVYRWRKAPSSDGRAADGGRGSTAASDRVERPAEGTMRCRAVRPLSSASLARLGWTSAARHAGVLDLEAEFVSQKPDIERHDDRAQQGRGEAELDHVGVVGGEGGDACPLLDAGIGEHGRQPCRAVGYLRVGACARLPGAGGPRSPQSWAPRWARSPISILALVLAMSGTCRGWSEPWQRHGVGDVVEVDDERHPDAQVGSGGGDAGDNAHPFAEVDHRHVVGHVLGEAGWTTWCTIVKE